jgi:hypothetical protein
MFLSPISLEISEDGRVSSYNEIRPKRIIYKRGAFPQFCVFRYRNAMLAATLPVGPARRRVAAVTLTRSPRSRKHDDMHFFHSYRGGPFLRATCRDRQIFHTKTKHRCGYPTNVSMTARVMRSGPDAGRER